MNAGKHGFLERAHVLLMMSCIGRFTAACRGTTQSNRSGGKKGKGEGGRSLAPR